MDTIDGSHVQLYPETIRDSLCKPQVEKREKNMPRIKVQYESKKKIKDEMILRVPIAFPACACS